MCTSTCAWTKDKDQLELAVEREGTGQDFDHLNLKNSKGGKILKSIARSVGHGKYELKSEWRMKLDPNYPFERTEDSKLLQAFITGIRYESDDDQESPASTSTKRLSGILDGGSPAKRVRTLMTSDEEGSSPDENNNEPRLPSPTKRSLILKLKVSKARLALIVTRKKYEDQEKKAEQDRKNYVRKLEARCTELEAECKNIGKALKDRDASIKEVKEELKGKLTLIH